MYEDFRRLSRALSDTHRYGAFLIALILLVDPARVLGAGEDAQTPPDLIHFCWTNCFSLSFGNGLYRRTDGADETWTVERFTSTTVILHRHSVPAAWNGFSADVTYQGQVSNDRLINVTLNGRAVPDINVAWGAALDTLPGSNAERDQRNVAQAKQHAIDVSPPPPTDVEPMEIEMRAAEAPPALLTEEQPPCTEDGYLWTPGYWAWGGGYYWVPGAWVRPPRVGVLWTPGYWGYAGAVYAFHPGYWGPHVGFYGGVNYGFGYPGVGFAGGRWVGNSFHNTYSESVVNNVALTKVSYNGGPGGITTAVTAQERAAAAEPHIPPTAFQRQRSQQAAGNPAFMARANDGHPTGAHPTDTRASDARATDTRPAAAVVHGAAPSTAPRAHSTVVRPAHASDAPPETVDRPNRAHSPPVTAANSEGSANQPAKPKPSSATATKPQHLPKP
jgi:WXXGXW repeat (2 copies)